MDLYSVRPASQKDLPVFVEIARRFTAESRLPYQFSLENTVAAFDYFRNHDGAAILIVEGAKGPAGGAIVAVDWFFVRRPAGILVKFFIMPGHRRTLAGRTLARACADWFDDRGCVDSWATITANIGQDAAFQALMGKVGFEPVAPTLRRQTIG